ncbi:MAG: tyrosine-protein phosphatase [Lachnospiraceae bacterium]|nr:tyrosine-protein phosphatase [Lachnospiraceae bacterium]
MNNTRKITFEKIQNCRDLGSIATSDGRYIRRKRLLRSANLSEAAESDIVKLKEYYHLKKIIDLRTTMEREQKPDVKIDGVEYIHNPIFDERMIGISHEKQTDSGLSSAGENPADIIPVMGNLYKRMVIEEACRDNLGKAIRLILTHDYNSGSVLWHCTEGKDRCGLVAAFILAILSVDKNIIMEDYLLTNEVNGPKAEMYYNKVLESGQPEEVALSVKDAFLAKEEYLNAAFAAIDKEYGGMENYIRDGLRIPEEMIEDFRSKMLMTMKYFITEEERKMIGGSCYFEFQKGDTADKCWKDDSLLLNMDIFDDLKIPDYIKDAVPEFDYYGITYVEREQWQQIFNRAYETGGQVKELFAELKPWAEECFEEYERFVIWGI